MLTCQLKEDNNAATMNLDGDETFDKTELESVEVQPRQDVTLTIHRADGRSEEIPLVLRIDTPIEIDYYLHGGILPYVLRPLLAAQKGFYGKYPTERLPCGSSRRAHLLNCP